MRSLGQLMRSFNRSFLRIATKGRNFCRIVLLRSTVSMCGTHWNSIPPPTLLQYIDLFSHLKQIQIPCYTKYPTPTHFSLGNILVRIPLLEKNDPPPLAKTIR